MTVADRAALIVIDVQESFRHRPYWQDKEVPAFLATLQRLIDGARQQGMPVVQILHVEPEGAFSETSGHVVPLSGLSLAADAMFRKTRHSALVGTGLEVWLTRHGITRLIICGIRTEQCCETTTRHASDLGWHVDYVTEATLTFPMTDATGRIVPTAEIRQRTELVLAGRFARIATVDQALAGPDSAGAAA